MLNPEYEGLLNVHQSVERFIGYTGGQITESLQSLGSRRFWRNFIEPQMIGVYSLLYGEIRSLLPLAELMKDQINVPNVISIAEGAGIMALGVIILYRFNRPDWGKLAE